MHVLTRNFDTGNLFWILVLQTPKDHSDWHKLEQAVSLMQAFQSSLVIFFFKTSQAPNYLWAFGWRQVDATRSAQYVLLPKQVTVTKAFLVHLQFIFVAAVFFRMAENDRNL